MHLPKPQEPRFEQKYIITEEVALQVRDFIRSPLDLDPHCVGKPHYSYSVHSLYLDSADLKLYWATISGDKPRFKLRLRFYGSDLTSPVFLEIKQTMPDHSRPKKRAPVRRDAVSSLLGGQTPSSDHVASGDPDEFSALEDFCERMHGLDARPVVHVAYFREAYVTGDNSARLTMDRCVRVQREGAPSLSVSMKSPQLIWGQDVVLELKFTDGFPAMFGDLVRMFGLRRCGAAKYVDGLAMLGEA